MNPGGESLSRSHPRPRVLVVDDERLNRQLVAAFLHREDYELIEADSGDAALALAASQSPDLVLLDVLMPGMSGFEVTRRLKEMAGDAFLPIVLITALGDTASRVKGFEAGADEFLQKPVDKLELMARVRNLLQLRFERRALSEQNKHLRRLQHFQQLATSLMVHDLKNPLSILSANIAYASMAIETSRDLQEARNALEDSLGACHRLQRRIAEVLDTARSEEGRLIASRRAVRIDKLLQEAARAFERNARDQQVSVQVVAAEGLTAEVDEELILRVIENLVENALRFTPPHKRIELRAGQAVSGAELHVCNEGAPIAPELRSRVFERFFHAEEAASASAHYGLGLYFCRLAVEAHGGCIEIVDDATYPTCFRVALPVTA